MKYKIYKLVDGNGCSWYQVKIKGLIFWHWAFKWNKFESNRCDVDGIAAQVYYKEIIQFSSELSAKEYIQNDIYDKNKRKTKVVECVKV